MKQQVDILVNGKPVKQIAHNGRIFIVAKHGTPYEIRLKNNGTSRVLAVPSVDGLNVINGEESKSDGAGYIINGYGSYTIRGYRTSNDEVHPFEFSTKAQSYANKSENGDTRDCGVIGVAFHSEKIAPIKYKIIKEKEYVPYYPAPPYYPWTPYKQTEPDWMAMSGSSGNVMHSMLSNSCNSFSGDYDQQHMISANNCSLDMGTKFSEESVQDSVVDSKFDINYELGRIEIFYASRKVLESMGIPVDKASAVAFPSAFKGFCKPPR